MKKLLSLLMFVAFSSNAAELVKGTDFTSLTGVSASTLNNLVDNARLAANRGMLISTNSAPAPTGSYAYLTNYVFLDWSIDPPQLKTWSVGGASWESATVGANTVTSAMIVNGTVANADMANNSIATVNLQDASVTTAKLVDSAVENAKIANNAVTSSKILDGAIVTDDLADGSVTTAKISDGTIATVDIANLNVTREKLALGAVDTTTITNATIKLEDMALDGGTSYQRLRVNFGATAWEWFTQPVPVATFTNFAAGLSSSTAVALGSTPTIVDGVELGSITITISKSNSLIKLETYTTVIGASAQPGILLFRDSVLIASTTERSSNGAYQFNLHLTTMEAPGAGTFTYSVRMIEQAGSDMNTVNGWNNTMAGKLVITEHFTEAP